MWQPTHVKVAVNQAKNLLLKGKNGTNDAFVVIGIGKEKFHTSIKQKASKTVEWREECELEIPSQGNKASIQLTVYHHNSLGIDEFLGQVPLPLSDFDVYEKPKYRFYKLKGKPEKDKKKGEKERGELEVLVNFLVKSGSFLDANKKEKTKSSTSLKNLGGSLMSFGGGKDKHGLKDFARSVSSKMDKIAKRKKSKGKSDKIANDLMESRQFYGDADPGVISDEDDDFRFDDDIKVFTRSSSPHSTISRGSSFVHEIGFDDDAASHTSHESSQVLGTSLLSYDTPNILGESIGNQRLIKSRTPSEIPVSPIDNSAIPAFAVSKPVPFEPSHDELSISSGMHASPNSSCLSYESDHKDHFDTIFEEKHDNAKLIDNSNVETAQPNKSNEQKLKGKQQPVTSTPRNTFVADSNKLNTKKDISFAETNRETLFTSDMSNEMNYTSQTKDMYGHKSKIVSKNIGILEQDNESISDRSDTLTKIYEDVLMENSDGSNNSRNGSFQEEFTISGQCGRKAIRVNSLTGSQDDVSMNGSMNISRSSSTQDVSREEYRPSKVKALTLNGKITPEDVENFEARRTKRKGMTAFKNKLFHKSSTKLEEDSRIVEGGNDRVPALPTRLSRLPQEVHDKFAGKSREDLLEMIMNMQGTVDKQVRRTKDLENYIDNLLLRVMEATPHILRASTPPNKIQTFKMY